MSSNRMAIARIAIAITVGVGAVAIVPQVGILGAATNKPPKCTILVTNPHARPGKVVKAHSRPCPKPFCPIGANSKPVVSKSSPPCTKVRGCRRGQVSSASKPCIVKARR